MITDPDDFIDDEEGQPISRGKKKRTVVHSDKALQEAQDVFGVDFDFADVEDYGSEYEDEDEEEVYIMSILIIQPSAGCLSFILVEIDRTNMKMKRVEAKVYHGRREVGIARRQYLKYLSQVN